MGRCTSTLCLVDVAPGQVEQLSGLVRVMVGVRVRLGLGLGLGLG